MIHPSPPSPASVLAPSRPPWLRRILLIVAIFTIGPTLMLLRVKFARDPDVANRVLPASSAYIGRISDAEATELAAFQRRCAFGEPVACRNAGMLLAKFNPGSHPDRNFIHAGCKLGDTESCSLFRTHFAREAIWRDLDGGAEAALDAALDAGMSKGSAPPAAHAVP